MIPTSLDGTKALLKDLKSFIPPLKPERLFTYGKEHKIHKETASMLNLLMHYEFNKFLSSSKTFTFTSVLKETKEMVMRNISEAYLESFQTYKMERLTKITNG